MKTILITGSSGFIGQYFVSKFKDEYKIIGMDLNRLNNEQAHYFYNINLINYKMVESIFKEHKIDYVIHTAAEKSLVACEMYKEKAYETNYLGGEFLYKLTKFYKSKFIFISSDQVFSGIDGLYSENAETNPKNYYGVLKELFENKIKTDSTTTICRTAMTFGIIPKNQIEYFNKIKYNDFLVVQGYIVQHVIYKGFKKETIYLPKNEYMNPTTVDLLYKQIRRVIENNITGILHCCGGERISRYDFGKKIAKSFGINDSFIKGDDSNDVLRPKDVSLDFKDSINKIGIKYLDIDTMIETIKNEMNK